MNLTSSTVLSLTGTWFLNPGSNMNLISSRDLARTCIACLLDRQFFENPPIWAGKIFYEKGFWVITKYFPTKSSPITMA